MSPTTPNAQGLRPEQTSDGWDRSAEAYARHLDGKVGVYAEDLFRLAPVDDSMSVIDVAAGAGSIALKAARRGARVLAVDFSPVLVDIVSRRVREEGLANVTAEVMDGQALAVGADSFDRAFSQFGLMMFPNRVQGFRELHRVLRPGGVAVASSWNAPPKNEWFGTFVAALKQTFPQMPPPPPPSFFEVADANRLKSEMEAGGFRDVRVETVSRTVEWDSADDYWKAVTQAQPGLPAMLERIGPDGVARLEATVHRILAEQAKAQGALRHEAEAHYAVGVKTH